MQFIFQPDFAHESRLESNISSIVDLTLCMHLLFEDKPPEQCWITPGG